MGIGSETIRIQNCQVHDSGYALPEVLVSSVILTTTVAASLQLTGTTLGGMNQSQLRSMVDNAIVEKVEDLRVHSFQYLCASNSGCQPDHLTMPLDYDDSAGKEVLKAICSNSGLGVGLKNYILSQDNSAESAFEVSHAGTTSTITPTLTPDGHRLNVLYSVNTPSMTISTTLVAHAHGWCP